MRKFRISCKEFDNKLIPWYIEATKADYNTVLWSEESSELIQQATAALGLKFLELQGCAIYGTLMVFEVIDEPLFVLTRMKLGV